MQLQLQNIGPFGRLDLNLSGLNLVCGPNAAGKSTLLDAMIFALTGHTRYEYKKDATEFRRHGAAHAGVRLAFERSAIGAFAIRRTMSGCDQPKEKVQEAFDLSEQAIIACLRSNRIIKLDPARRKTLIVNALGASDDVETWLASLNEILFPYEAKALQAGCDGADLRQWHKLAVDRRIAAKRELADVMRATAFDFDAVIETHAGKRKLKDIAVKDINAKLKKLRERMTLLTGRLAINPDDLEAKRQRFPAIAGDIEKASSLAEELAKVRQFIKELHTDQRKWEEKLRNAEAELGKARGICPVLNEPCDRISGQSEGAKQTAMKQAENAKTGLECVNGHLDKQKAALAGLMQRTQESTSKETLELEAQTIQKELERFEDFDTQAAEKEVATIKARLDAGGTLRDKAIAWNAAREQSAKAATVANEYQETVDRWNGAVNLLAPGGSLDKPKAKNKARLFTAEVQKAMMGILGSEVDIDAWHFTLNGTPEAGLSASERWRIGVALQHGIALTAGFPVLVVDNLEILVGTDFGRGLKMLLDISPQYETVIAMMSLGQPPEAKRSDINYWYIHPATNDDPALVERIG